MRLEYAGLLYAATPAPPTDVWPLYDLRGVRPWVAADTPSDYRSRAMLPFYAYQRASQAARQAQWPEAYGFLAIAKSIGPDVLWLQANAVFEAYRWGAAAFAQHDAVSAAHFFHAILAWDPHEDTARTDLRIVERSHP